MLFLSVFSAWLSVIKSTCILHHNFAAVHTISKPDPEGFKANRIQNLREEPLGFFAKKTCTTANQTLNPEV